MQDPDGSRVVVLAEREEAGRQELGRGPEDQKAHVPDVSYIQQEAEQAVCG